MGHLIMRADLGRVDAADLEDAHTAHRSTTPGQAASRSVHRWALVPTVGDAVGDDLP
jgi:hypothetical protein